jgi:hypothetical protein
VKRRQIYFNTWNNFTVIALSTSAVTYHYQCNALTKNDNRKYIYIACNETNDAIHISKHPECCGKKEGKQQELGWLRHLIDDYG